MKIIKEKLESPNLDLRQQPANQPASHETYSDVKHTDRKLLIKSTILDGQTLDLSYPR